MEPTLPAPNMNPERSPVDYGQNYEKFPLPPTPETGIERGVEQVEQRSEAPPAAVNATPILPSPVLTVVPTPVVTDESGVTADDSGLPVVAGDDDVIEKEWVDKAKKIISETRDDPHKREQEVAKLQIDYLRKRYGKELGSFDV